MHVSQFSFILHAIATKIDLRLRLCDEWWSCPKFSVGRGASTPTQVWHYSRPVVTPALEPSAGDGGVRCNVQMASAGRAGSSGCAPSSVPPASAELRAAEDALSSIVSVGRLRLPPLLEEGRGLPLEPAFDAAVVAARSQALWCSLREDLAVIAADAARRAADSSQDCSDRMARVTNAFLEANQHVSGEGAAHFGNSVWYARDVGSTQATALLANAAAGHVRHPVASGP